MNPAFVVPLILLSAAPLLIYFSLERIADSLKQIERIADTLSSFRTTHWEVVLAKRMRPILTTTASSDFYDDAETELARIAVALEAIANGLKVAQTNREPHS